jgi:hypothetical protein
VHNLIVLALLTAILPSMEARYCLAGAAMVCDSVLVVCAMQTSWCENVRSTLRGTGAFTTVDAFDASISTPSSSQLAGYHAVFVFSDNGRAYGSGFSDPRLMGDRLANYHNQGGGVVVAWKSNVAQDAVRLLGAYGLSSNGYTLTDWSQGSGIYPSDSLGWFDIESPLMKDVRTLDATHAFQSTAPLISGRGVLVASWRNGQPLVVRGTKGTRTLVELNFFPVTSTVNSWFSGWTGDGAKLMRNALKFSRCMLCEPGTFAGAGDRGGMDSKGMQVSGFGNFCFC